MATGSSGNPAGSSQTQANRITISPPQIPLIPNSSNNPNANLITQSLQGIIQALTALTVQINAMNFAAPPPHHNKNSKNKSKDAKKRELCALVEAIFENYDD
ncbi:hypothetical protein TNIN_10541 [Trichonephila inaurata madagascariensis]|uniref:Uncharacterized protein n=1 Tax=Trichonephila inaurata madagascariensis TaxID=2747483 RepID=A0A8X6WNR7_9ARAC|nr:hypothetical protein TNIN_10541 [Trichonephila inaurata madagascariensis]